MRLALIHALRHSPPPIEEAFARLWPGQTLMNLLDDSLSADLAREGKLTPRMTERFLTLARYAAGTGADGILFTCSAFGPCIEACARDLAPMPVLKPNEAMIEEAITKGKRIVWSVDNLEVAKLVAEPPAGQGVAALKLVNLSTKREHTLTICFTKDAPIQWCGLWLYS